MKIKSTIKKASTFSLFTALSVFASGFSPTSIEGTLSPLDAPIDKTTTFTNTTDKTVSYSYRARQLTRPASQAQATAALSVPKPEITEDYLDGKEYVEGRFFVSINEFAGYRASSSLPAVLSKYKIKKSKEINKKKNKAFKAFSGISKKSYVITLEDKSKQALKKALKELSKDPQVNYVHPDWKVSLNATPNDESFDNLWGMHNTGQLGGIPGADISAVEAWDISTGSENVIIGVIDSGVDYLHPDLKDNMWVNVNEIPDNGIDDDGNGYIDDINGYDFYNNDADPMDDHNHGTHVSGTIAGKANNNIGVAGVMWKAKIMALKFISKDNEGSLEGAIAAINYATDMGAALTNNSWGGGGYAPALEEAIAAGPLFVAAAGNDNVDNDLFPHYPSSYDLDNIISVAASDRYDHRSDFSQWGLTTVDLAAPGSSIYSSLRNNTYGSFNGTSMATPHVSGVAGLIKSISPTLTAIEVKNILLSSVDPLDAFAGLTVTGGRLNAHTSLINTSPKWVTITDNGNGTLAPGESITLSMTFDANELDAGAWTSVLDFTTNDGAETVHTLPITMNVLECRTLDFDAQSVTFPDTWVGDFSMQTIRISNTCNAATSISSIMATTSEFTPNIAAPLVIGARSSITIPVTFAPLDETNYLNELVILSDAENASEITAELIGTGLFGPQVVINPVEVSEVLEGEQTSHIPVVISNPGARDLIFTLNDAFADKNTWLSFPTQEFTVASGDAETIQVTLASANLLGGVYNASITVSHNAVGNKVSTIPVTLTIEADNFFTPVETDLNWGTVTNPTQPNFTFSPANGLDSSDGGFTLVDMDQDGDLDFLASSNWEDPYRKLDYATLYWVENTDVCDGRWVEHKILDEFMGMYYGMDAGDIDGDGDMDIITQTGYRGHGNELFWLENDGNFNFTRHDLNGPNMLNNIKLMDFDNDGDLDLTAKSDFYTDPLIDIFINDGSGNFVEHQYFTGSSADMQILDYNNDGFLDFVGNERDNDLGVSQYVWYENGQDNATFTKRVLIADLGGSKSETVDFDNDGDLDLVYFQWEDSYGIKWYEQSNGSFIKHDLTEGYSLYYKMADFDNDGDLDFVHFHHDEHGKNTSSYLENNNQVLTQIPLVNGGLTFTAVADFNNDSDLDLLVSNVNSSTGLEVLENNFIETRTARFSNTGGSPTQVSSITSTNPLFSFPKEAPLEIPPISEVCFDIAYDAQHTSVETGTFTLMSDAMDHIENVITVQAGSPDPTDVALNKLATASSTEGIYSASHVIDSDGTSRWSSDFADPQWIAIDLQGSFDVSEVVLEWEAAAAKVYTLQTSTDGTSWTTIYTENNGNSGTDVITVSASNVAHIRMHGTQRTTEWGYSLYSFKVLGIPHVVEPARLTTITVTPDAATIYYGEKQQYSAQGFDQYGLPFAITPTWFTNGGFITSEGLFTPSYHGTYVVTAQAGGLTASASLISLPQLTLSSITITPTVVALGLGETQQFNAQGYDQHGDPIDADMTWAVTGNGGTITHSGLFYATTASTTTEVTVSSGIYSATASVTVTSTPVDVALNKPTTASSNEDGYSSSKAVDGDGVSRWASDFSDPQWIMVDLESKYDLTNVTLSWETAAAAQYQIQVSEDGIYWTTAYSTTSGNGGIDNVTITSKNVQYVRMFGTKRTTEWGYSLYSFEVYGTPATVEPPVLSSITVTPLTSELYVDDVQQFLAQGFDQFGVPMNTTVGWAIGGNAGHLNSHGLFFAQTAGESSTIYATSGTVTGTATVTVIEAPVLTTITVSPLTVAVGSIGQIMYQAYDQFGNPSDLGAQPSYSTTGGGWIKDGHFNAETAGTYTLTMSVGSVSGTATVTVVEAGTDLVSNGDFNNGTTNWLIDGYNGASVSGYVNNGEYTAAISNGGTEAWTVQMKQNSIPLVQGRQYTIRFDARAASNRTVDVKLETDGSPWDNYGNLSPTAITTTMATYEHTFTMNTTDLNARLVLNLGGNSADVVFDNIEVIEVP